MCLRLSPYIFIPLPPHSVFIFHQMPGMEYKVSCVSCAEIGRDGFSRQGLLTRKGLHPCWKRAHESLTWRHRLSVAIISSASGLTARGYQHSTSTLPAPALLSRMITVTPTVACHSHPDNPSTCKRWLAVRQMKSTPRFMSLNR